MIKIYDDIGYVDIGALLSRKYPYNFIVGGRGTGKTYGALLNAVKDGRRFMLLRRTQSQADLICKSEFSPFKSINRDQNMDVQPKAISRFNVGFYKDGELIGYGAALSTFSSLRGFDASEIDLLIYDEFIPEKHEKAIKGEGEAFANTIETIARNREVQGGKPLQVLCLANSNDLGNPIFTALNLTNTAQKMKQKKKTLYMNDRRGVLIAMLDNSPISQAKKNTSLYKLMAGTDFEKMALDNEFYNDDMEHIRSMPLIEYRAICAIKNICIYKHKARNEYYITKHKSGAPKDYGPGKSEALSFWRDYSAELTAAYTDSKIFFETFQDRQQLEEVLGINKKL